MERMTPPVLTVTGLIFFLLFCCSSACHVDDRRALLAFKNTLTPGSFPSSWTTESDCCFWEFVRCSKRNGRVRVISVKKSNNVSGTIPPSVGDLPFLEILFFRRVPNLVGPIPPQLSKLKNLQVINIDQTGVSGSIPPSLSKITQLQELFLTNNHLTGPIPASLGDLTHLFLIELSGNKLTGTIPGTLFSKYSFTFTTLELDLNDNMLTGGIPPEFEKVKFMFVNFSSNELCGKIPSGGSFSQFGAESFQHNKCLCGTPLPPCK